MFTLNCKGKLLLIDQPLVMGIINVTSDSFYAKSRVQTRSSAIDVATKMIEEGVDIIDIGAESTRPGSQPVDANQEREKVVITIEGILNKFPETIISVDTYRSTVAIAAIEAGASIINDISGGSFDKEMIATAGRLQVPYICMHLNGTPENMQQHTSYENLLREIVDYFVDKIKTCEEAGIKDLIIDPGFGFAKNIDQNFMLLKNLAALNILDKPVLCGLSRKSSIYKTLHISVGEALNGTTVLNTLALVNGASLLRVHDVKEAKEAVKLFVAYQKA